MAKLKDIVFTYDDFDLILPILLGDFSDFSAAFYNGNFDKSLLQAQKDKHQWVLRGIGFKKGDRVLDIGCGWGPMLKAIKDNKGKGVGITLSPKQVAACAKHGLNARLLDWKKINPDEFSKFDQIVSLGAFEHFCSVEEYLGCRQEKIYGNFFKLCHQLLEGDGCLYLQTMIWGDHPPWGLGNKPNKEFLDRYNFSNGPKQSDQRILVLVKAFFPGSFLPLNENQILKAAAPYFKAVSVNDGRMDYIQTLTEWVKAWYAPKPGKFLAKLKLLPNYLLKGRQYWLKIQSIEEHAVREVFIRRIFGHRRIFFKKR